MVAETPNLKPVYLLTGTDRPKIDTAVGRLRRHFEPESVEGVSAQDVSGEETVALCNSGSLFGDLRLVLVDGVDGRRNSEGRLTNGWKVADISAVTDYLASPAPGTVLALVAEALKKDSALAKACAKAGDLLSYDVQKKNLAGWVFHKFAERGVEADREACAAFVQIVGEDLHQLAAEVDKLATWARGEPIGEREVEELSPALAETSDYKLADIWSKRDLPSLLELSEVIFDRDPKARRDVSARLAARFGGQVVSVARANRLKDAGVGVVAAQKSLGFRSDWQARRAYQQAESFSQAELDVAVLRIADLDLALKGKGRLPPDLEFQRALVDLGRKS